MLLENLCLFQSGGTPSKSNPDYYGGNIPWITTVALNGGLIDGSNAVDWINAKAIEGSAAKIVPAHSIMVGTRVGVGKVAINTVPMSTSQDVVSLIGIDDDRWDKQYISLFIQSKSKQLNEQARGATIKGIKIDSLSKLDVPDISIVAQHHVVACLESIRRMINGYHQQFKTLDDLIKARFVEMFRNCNNIQYLDDLCDFVTVGIANAATHAYSDQGVVMLRNLNILENHLDDKDLVHITPEFAAKYKGKALMENDILVTRTGYPGRACLVPKKYQGCQTFTTLIVRLMKEAPVTPMYVCQYINSDFGKRYVDKFKNGSSQQNFGATALAQMGIRIPDYELQREFGRFVSQVDKSKAVVQKALDEAQLLFDSLMQQYFG